MKVKDAMSTKVFLATPDQTIEEAAKTMADIDAGSIPVTDNDKLIGMLTDRDIAIRAVAKGLGPETPVRDVMSKDIKYCYEDEDLDDVAQNMSDIQLRRLPVMNRDKRLVGILSLGDMAKREEDLAGHAMAGIARPNGAHAGRHQ